MLETKDIKNMFCTLQAFEDFRLEWIKICAKLNKNGRNAQILDVEERRAEVMKEVADV